MSDHGDTACWADRVCDVCGSVVEDGPSPAELPEDVVRVRSTPTFDAETTPAGLLRAHRVAPEVWGRLVVEEGCVGFRFEDEDHVRHVAAASSIVIPPERPHAVEPDGRARFHVEFHRRADS